MDKPKRSPTLDSFVVKKPKNISTISSELDSDQHEISIENVIPNDSLVNIDQHIINSHTNEITPPPVSPEHNQSIIEENNTSLQRTVNNHYSTEKNNNTVRSALVSESIIRCEKLIGNLLSLKKTNEHIDTLLTMFKSTNNSKELCTRETYIFSDNILKIINDLRLNCETYLAECVNNRPPVSDSLQTCLERDPGGYVNLPRFSNDELKHLVALGPYQPRLSTYPKLKKSKENENDEISVESVSRKTTSFQARWYDDYPLIEYSILKDKIYCFVCRLFGYGPGALCADSAWTIKGLQQWSNMTGKNGKLIKHFQSTSHTSAVQRLQMFKDENSHVDIQLNRETIYVNHHRQELLKLNRYVILTLLDATKFLARQSLSFRGDIESEGNFNQIVSFIRRHNNMLDQWYKDTSTRNYQITYLSNRAQNEFISIIGKTVHDSVINRLNKSLFWSIMVDSTPDVSHKDIMSIIVRFINENEEVEERLLFIKEIKHKTGKNIADNVLQICAKLGLDINKLIGQSYDGASNMSGEYKGVQAVVSESIGREIMFIPCCAHRSNKIVEHASQNSLEAKKFFDICEKIYVFITGSTKRSAVLREIYAASINEDSLSLKSSTETRWSSQYNSIIAIYESYAEIIEVLDELRNDDDKMTKLEAYSIREKIVSYEFYCVLLFIKHLMSMTNALTTTLQKENLDILLTIDTLTKTICLLNQIRTDEDTINKLLELAKERMEKYNVDADDEFNKRHPRRLKSLRIDSNAHNESILVRQVYYRKVFYQIIDQLNNEYTDLLKTLEDKLKHFICLYPSNISSFRIEDAEKIKIIVPGIDNSDLLYYDVQLLKDNIQQCRSINDVMALFMKNNYKCLYSRLHRVYSFILTLPVTVASNERTFSRLKLIKNRLRSTMLDDRLMNLILCASEKDILDSINLDELVTIWSTNKERRLQV